MAGSKKTVLKSLALITQLGIMMITPIALCLFIGLLIDHNAGTNWVFIPFLVLGMVAGLTSVYKTVMSVVKQDEAEKAANKDPVTEKILASLSETPYQKDEEQDEDGSDGQEIN